MEKKKNCQMGNFGKFEDNFIDCEFLSPLRRVVFLPVICLWIKFLGLYN